MDVTKIRLNGLYSVDLPLRAAHPSDTFILKAADGLGPTGADVSISGNVYQGRQPLNREFVFRIGLNPNYSLNQTAEQLREMLYGMLMPDRTDGAITVTLYNEETVLAKTLAWVSKIELALFTKEPEVQLTMPCPGAYLEAPNSVTLTPSAKLAFNITNQGTAPTGIQMSIKFTQAMTQWVVRAGGRKMQFEANFEDNDILTFNTQEGQRSVKRTRGGVEREFIQSLSAGSSWIELHGGVNAFTTSDSGFTWQSVTYTPLYLGV
jgi:hypothetical protein